MAETEKGIGWGWLAVAGVATLAGFGLRLHATDLVADNGHELVPLVAAREVLDCGFGFVLVNGLHAAILALYRGLGQAENGAVWLGMFATVLTVVPVYAAGRRLWGNAVAAAAAVFWSLGPWGILCSADISPAALMVFLFAAAVWGLAAGLSGSRLGGLAGAAALVLVLLTPGKIYSLTLSTPGLDLWGPMGVGAVLLALAAAAGIAAAWSTPARKSALAVGVAALAGLAAAAALPGLLALPAAPLCVLAGLGAAEGPGFAGRRWGLDRRAWPRRAVWLAAGALLLGSAATGTAESDRIQARDLAPTSNRLALFGLRQAAINAADGVKVPEHGCPGPTVCAGSAYFPYYFNGTAAALPESTAELSAALQRGQCAYVVLDSITVRFDHPGLKAALTAEALPGADLIFRQYLLDYNLLVSVYRPAGAAGAPAIRLGIPALAADDREGVTRLHQWAVEYGRQGLVEQQRQLLQAIINAKPGNALAHREMMKVLLILGRFDGVSLDKADDELRRYAFLFPDDPNLESYRQTIRTLRTRHQAEWGTGESKN